MNGVRIVGVSPKDACGFDTGKNRWYQNWREEWKGGYTPPG
jgi:hypothetical protein